MKEITRKKMSNYPSKSISAISEFLFIENDIEQLKYSDLVIVLGNDFIEGTIRSVSELYNNGIITDSSRIILSGATGSVNKGKEPECERMYNCAVDEYNMPPHLFFKEPNATNAYENFKYSLEIINNWGGFDQFSNILVIGKAFLLRRASMYAAKFNYPSYKMQYYGTVDKDGLNIGKTTWWQNDKSIARVMAEIERIGKYYQLGDLSIF